jgi:hypothetical protein
MVNGHPTSEGSSLALQIGDMVEISPGKYFCVDVPESYSTIKRHDGRIYLAIIPPACSVQMPLRNSSYKNVFMVCGIYDTHSILTYNTVAHSSNHISAHSRSLCCCKFKFILKHNTALICV